jgi:predicted metal-dependent peptidase
MEVVMETVAKKVSLKDRWDWVISFMVLEDLFVHEILLMMDKRPSTAVDTMGVTVKDARLILYYNESFVAKLTDPELRYILTHEIYHLILHHCTKRMPEDPEIATLWNIAADLAVNSLIPISADRKPPVDEDGKQMGCFPKDPQFGYEEKLSMEQYLQLLQDKSDGKGNGKGKGKGSDKEPNGFDDHTGWGEDELIDQMVKDKVEQLSRSERAWGKLSSEAQAIILAAQRSQVPWTKVLRNFFGHLISADRIPSFKKPDRRYPYPYCGKVNKNIDRKLVAIDTSGSVGDLELSQFLCEVNKLSEIQPVDVMLFDWDITQLPKPFDRKKKSYDFKGRGGTNFEPVMRFAEAKKYSSLIILTDGEAAAPTRPKYVKDIIWVLTGKSDPPVEWGKRVRVENKVGY